MEGHPESKKCLRIHSAHLFCSSRSLVSDVKCNVEKLPHEVVRPTLSRGKCRDIRGHGCADWESLRLWGVRCYSFSAGRWDLRLSCRRGKARMELFCCTTMHVYMLPGRQALLRGQFHWDIFSSSLRIARTWHRRTSSCFQTWRSIPGKRFANGEDLKGPHDMKRITYTQTCAKVGQVL